VIRPLTDQPEVNEGLVVTASDSANGEKKGGFRPKLRAARFLGKEPYRAAYCPTGAEHQPPVGNYRALGAGKFSGMGAYSES
jgi:hypothetical protein